MAEERRVTTEPLPLSCQAFDIVEFLNMEGSSLIQACQPDAPFKMLDSALRLPADRGALGSRSICSAPILEQPMACVVEDTLPELPAKYIDAGTISNA